MRKHFSYILAITGLLITVSCKKNSPINYPAVTQPGDIKAAPDGFNFVTSKMVDLSVRLLTNKNLPIKGVVVNFLKPGTTTADGVLFKAISDANGYLKGAVSVPSYLDTLVIQPNYPGLINNAKALITANTLIATLGGTEGYSGSVVPEPLKTGAAGSSDPRVFTVDPNTGIDIVYPSPYKNSSDATKSNGVPKYLENDRDDISDESLQYMAYAFPEGSKDNVSSVHPEYFTSAVTSVNMLKTGYLYITFISEGASYTNSLGYYNYTTSNPPKSASDIDKVTLAFPNASGNGSGGGLHAGDKVKIGPFNAGTTVGFVILQNAWTGSGVSVSSQKFFSNPDLNPENTSALKRHNFMLNVPDFGLYLFGFEDLNRQTSSTNPDKQASDNDFNDVLFYITPGTGTIDGTGVAVLGASPDADGDGVNDTEDEFPNDVTRAYTEVTAWKTLAFEDLWPTTGDYDMNDVVIQYRYNYVKNADNNYVEMTADYNVLAAGAVYNDGFGVEFPFAPSVVKSVTGYKLIRNYITLGANGLETGQTKAVIIPFDDYHAVINNTGISNPAINTNPLLPKVTADPLHVNIIFNSPITAATLNATAFNPFLIGSIQRGYEIHLSGKTPTDKANKTFLGTGNDKSNITTGKYYQTVNNWPWAIDISGTFIHPTEGTPISTAYGHFLDWAQSGGVSYTDWYSNTATGYRVLNLIFSK